jgi:hypothetical protein
MAKVESLELRIQKARKEELSIKAVVMKREGKNFREIAHALQISIEKARKWTFEQMYKDAGGAVEDAEILRDINYQRIEALMGAHWKKAQMGDVGATLAIIQLIKRESEMFGLDAPKRTEMIGVTANLTAEDLGRMSNTEIKQRLEEAVQRSQRLLPTGTDDVVEAETVTVTEEV